MPKINHFFPKFFHNFSQISPKVTAIKFGMRLSPQLLRHWINEIDAYFTCQSAKSNPIYSSCTTEFTS